MIELRSARSLSLGERAELFNAGYEGYVVPVHIEPEQLAKLDEAYDFDADASRIAFRDGVPVGFASLDVRGEDAYVGGVGVVMGARRTGIGEVLMRALHEEAQIRGVQRIWLEVIDSNLGAVALYEKLGYRHVRDVDVWRLEAADGEAVATEVDPTEVELPDIREPWQRAPETIAHYDDVRGLVCDGGAALFRVGQSVQLLRYSGNPEPLFRTLQAYGDVSVLNLPADDPAADVLRALGGTVSVRQHEMVLTAAR